MAVREAIAIVELIVYIPAFLTTLAVLFKHGFQKQLGWIYLLIFTIVRIAGAVFEVLHNSNKSNSTYTEWALILQSVGISPLLLASFGLLKRVIDFTSTHVRSQGGNFMASLGARGGLIAKLAAKASADSRRSRVIQLLQLPCTIALILCIEGGTAVASSNPTPSDIKSGKTDTKWGIGIFVVLYLILVILTLYSMFEVNKTARGEKRILIAVVIALPLIGSRVLYSILDTFHTNHTFNLENGNAIVQLFMATIEEAMVVVLYAVVGLTVHKYGEGGVLRAKEENEQRKMERRRTRRNDQARTFAEQGTPMEHVYVEQNQRR
jgi:hypothetical protein